MQRNRRIIDISPPASKKSASLKHVLQESEKKIHKPLRKGRFPVVWFIGISVFLICVSVFGAFQFFFSFATITVWPRMRPLSLSDTFMARINQSQIDFSSKIIPGKVFSIEESATKLYKATGSKSKDLKAEGIIKVFNNQQKTQILVATTRFMSQDGKLFRSTERISVLPGSSQDVHVTASEAGPEYNIGPSNFSIPGLAGTPLYTLVYGKSSQSMTQGAHSQVSVVTGSDIANAENSLVNDLANMAKSELQKQMAFPYSMENSSSQAETLEVSSLVKEGGELEQFNVKAKVRLTALAFDKAQMEELARHLLEAQLRDAEKMNPKSFQAAFVPKTFDLSASQLSLSITAQASAYEDIDLTAVQAMAQGQKKADAIQALSEDSRLLKSKVSLWPFWITSVPQEAKRIRVVLSLD